MLRDVRAFVFVAAACTALVLAAPGPAESRGMTEVVVTLEAPSLATAVRTSRVLTAAAKARRLDLGSPMSRAYVEEVDRQQDEVERRIETTLRSARVRWHYTVVLDGFSVLLPRGEIAALRTIPGVKDVYPGMGFRATLDRSPRLIGADELWNDPAFPTAGEGVKIGIIDDGVDPSHPFFDPTGYTYPAGFPKGNRQFTTPKVIVARSFAPASTTWKYARLPFDSAESEHGTHVAGIAAGDPIGAPVQGRSSLSGVAPRAYIGNYKALSTPSRFGLIDNAPEIVAAIEAAVKDGMDVINMSFGEFETDPARSPVDEAVDGAAAAGVVPVAAAGNSYDELGRGSIGSPATAAGAISVGAVTKSDVVASWSSSGPTGLSLRLKPEVSAPGVGILSSVPARLGSWSSFSGTSMAAPHVAGAAALLRQRHRSWTVDQLASALVLTAEPTFLQTGSAEAPTTREGGGVVDLPDADKPLVAASPFAISFGMLRPCAAARAQIDLTDVGGGAGTWNVSTQMQTSPGGVKMTTPRTVSVPGGVIVDVAVAPAADEADLTGFIVLEHLGVTRRIPFWLRVAQPRLGSPARVLRAQGRYDGDTRGGQAAVTSYRYPDDPGGSGLPTSLRGPEQVFRLQVSTPVANIGVHVTQSNPGVRVTPRIVRAGDENQIAGVPALPLDVNPYRDSYGADRPVAAVIRPSPGAYDVVFDSVLPSEAGRFAFRVWVDDVTPPRVRLLTPAVSRDGDIILAAADGGSGVDPHSATATVDGREAPIVFRAGRFRVLLDGIPRPGRHRLVVTVADFQETKNSESVVGILSNTTIFRTSFRVK